MLSSIESDDWLLGDFRLSSLIWTLFFVRKDGCSEKMIGNHKIKLMKVSGDLIEEKLNQDGIVDSIARQTTISDEIYMLMGSEEKNAFLHPPLHVQ